MKSKYRAESFLVIVLGCGYLGLTFYSLWRWNESVSGALISGFVLFAQSIVSRYFDTLDARNENTPVLVTPTNQPVTATPVMQK